MTNLCNNKIKIKSNLLSITSVQNIEMIKFGEWNSYGSFNGTDISDTGC